jgi:hypothetical protein
MSVNGPPLRQHVAKYSAMDTDYILHRNSTAYCIMGSLFFLHRGTRHRWGELEKVPMNGPIIVYVSLSTLTRP